MYVQADGSQVTYVPVVNVDQCLANPLLRGQISLSLVKQLISCGIGFLKTTRKDGIHLLLTLKNTFARFNTQILRLFDELGDDLFLFILFPSPAREYGFYVCRWCFDQQR